MIYEAKFRRHCTVSFQNFFVLDVYLSYEGVCKFDMWIDKLFDLFLPNRSMKQLNLRVLNIFWFFGIFFFLIKFWIFSRILSKINLKLFSSLFSKNCRLIIKTSKTDRFRLVSPKFTPHVNQTEHQKDGKRRKERSKFKFFDRENYITRFHHYYTLASRRCACSLALATTAVSR